MSKEIAEDLRYFDTAFAAPDGILESLGQFIIPLPPLSEQHRIVARIDQLIALCDTLEQSINAATVKQTDLLNVVMSQKINHQAEISTEPS